MPGGFRACVASVPVGFEALKPEICRSHTPRYHDMALPRPSRYPVMMSSDIPWASGVGPNAIMQQKHDLDLLDEELRRGGGEGL